MTKRRQNCGTVAAACRIETGNIPIARRFPGARAVPARSGWKSRNAPELYPLNGSGNALRTGTVRAPLECVHLDEDSR